MQERWSDEREQELRKLFDDPRHLSASEIALAMGDLTRNAVIGKVGRLGLQRAARVVIPKRPPPRRNNLTNLMWDDKPPFLLDRKPKNRKPPQPARPARIETNSLRIGILATQFFNCKWVLDEKGSDGLALMCGLPVHDRSFCKHHYRIVYAGFRYEAAAAA